MSSLLKALLMAAVAGTWANDELCDSSEEKYLDCGGTNLSMPPPGHWENTTTLDLSNNAITDLPKNSLNGFPTLEILDLSQNSFTKFNFDEIASSNNLWLLQIQRNQIDNLMSPAGGISQKKLEIIFAYDNRISHLNPNVFSFASNLRYLNMRGNPLVVEMGQPVLNHTQLKELDMNFGGTDLKVVDSSLLSGLPNLRKLRLYFARISSVDGAFVNQRHLEEIVLSYNNISQISRGTFFSGGVLKLLDLQGNPLTKLDHAALDNTMVPGGIIDINDTPLARACGYEDLFKWARSKSISIRSGRGGQPVCSFIKT